MVTRKQPVYKLLAAPHFPNHKFYVFDRIHSFSTLIHSLLLIVSISSLHSLIHSFCLSTFCCRYYFCFSSSTPVCKHGVHQAELVRHCLLRKVRPRQPDCQLLYEPYICWPCGS